MGARAAAICAAVVTLVCALVAAYLLVAVVPDDDRGASEADFAAERESAEENSYTDGPRVPVDQLPSLGIQYHGTWSHYTEEKRQQVLDTIEQSGSTWVRLDVGWASLQPEPGEFAVDSWGVEHIDSVIADLEDRDLKVLVMFWLTPDWATSAKGDRRNFGAPDDPNDFARAIGWAADRWGDEVDAWEVWNEPNLDAFFPGTDPREYAKLLCAAYPAVHRNDDDAQVVFGGLMFADDKFLDTAYRGGAKGCYDVMAVHSYQAPADEPPTMINTGEYWNLVHLRAIRDVMEANDDPHPIWITEFGWSVHDNDDDTVEWQRGVSEQEQAEYAVDFMELIAEEFPYVKAAFWYKDVQNNESSDEHQEGFAMIRDDGTTRPVFDAFRQLYRLDGPSAGAGRADAAAPTG